RDGDVYRLSATAAGRGWSAWLPNDLATAKAGGRTAVTVYARHATGAAHLGTVKVTATSESDPAKKATTVCAVVG
ncbi:peptidase M6, partial [Actinoallomurus acaciae]